jgi:hypothetical protein
LEERSDDQTDAAEQLGDLVVELLGGAPLDRVELQVLVELVERLAGGLLRHFLTTPC